MSHILLIDDDELVRFALSMALQMAGFQVTEAEHGADPTVSRALAQHDTPVHLIISDIVMPEKEGIELLMELRRQHPNIPVINISGGGRISGQDYLKTAERLGAVATFSKPLNEEALIEKIREILA